VRTGIAIRLGDWLIAKAGGSETRLLVLLTLANAGLGSVMSSTGVVAIFIPSGNCEVSRTDTFDQLQLARANLSQQFYSF
jgi:hypothetical protein